MKAEIIPVPDLTRAETRLPRWMWAWVVLATATALVAGQARTSAGLALGGALGILNYYWLHQAVSTLFDATRTRVPGLLVIKFLIRYPLAFGLVYLFYRTGWLPFLWIMAGLFAPVAGVLTEGVVQLCQGLRRCERTEV